MAQDAPATNSSPAVLPEASSPERWTAPSSPWLAKLRRAEVHITDLDREIRAYVDEEPYRVIKGPGRTPNEWAYSLSVEMEVPPEIATIVGDAVHNMRSALDSFAYSIATRHVDEKNLSERAIRDIQFPIKKTSAEFEKFFQNPNRAPLFDSRDILAMRCIQPFALPEEALSYGLELEQTADWNYAADEIQRLDRLARIDKHRRLPLTAWFPRLTSWMGTADEHHYEPAQLPGNGIYEDGAILGYFRTIEGVEPPKLDPEHDISLALADDVYRESVVETLRSLHRYLLGWALPRSISVLSGADKPPMMISSKGH